MGEGNVLDACSSQMRRRYEESIRVSPLATFFLLAIGSASSQTAIPLKAKIPFDFTAGNTTSSHKSGWKAKNADANCLGRVWKAKLPAMPRRCGCSPCSEVEAVIRPVAQSISRVRVISRLAEPDVGSAGR